MCLLHVVSFILIHKNMYLVCIFSPFIGSALAGLFGRHLGFRGSWLVSAIFMALSFICSVTIGYEVILQGSAVSIDLGYWFSAGSVSARWGFHIDTLTVCMLFTVTLVSSCVHIYSYDYMNTDPHLPRFMSYLSLFTGFMLVLVSADNMLQMLVGWEGNECLIGNIYCCLYLKQNRDNWLKSQKIGSFRKQDFTLFKSLNSNNFSINQWKSIRMFYKPRIPAKSRTGPHTFLFKQILTGFLLGDGWIELHGKGARLGISLTVKFADVAQWYKLLFYGLGYTKDYTLSPPLTRNNRTNPYYKIRTFSFESLIKYRNMWYTDKQKTIPKNIEQFLTPLCLCIWVMGDGSGMKDGGFKISSHSFSREDNQLLCDLLFKLYGIKANVLVERKNLTYIRIWKRSVPTLKNLIMPYLLSSCYYKFRYI